MGQLKTLTRIGLFGAALDTPNLGLMALSASTVDLLSSHFEDLEVLVFGFKRQKWRTDLQESRDGDNCIRIREFGAISSKRIWRSDSVFNMNVASYVGGGWNSAVRWLKNAHAVLDLTGGDSFTDLYGDLRCKMSIQRKKIAIRANGNLLLLPQTYGPFKSPSNEKRAAEVVKSASIAWARDSRSFEILKRLLGSEFDPEKHRCGIDQAFGLKQNPCLDRLPRELQNVLSSSNSKLKVGINVSGLIYNDQEEAAGRYGLKINYGDLIRDLLKRINLETDATVLLVPHVLASKGSKESDIAACEDVHKWSKANNIETHLAPLNLDCRESKWLINQMDWFCGTRMHSAIASLSGCTPVTAIAYSDKVQGVFDGCDVGGAVVDPRISDAPEILDRLMHELSDRNKTRNTLLKARERWSVLLEEQTKHIASAIIR